MGIDFNNIRKQMAYSMDRIIKKLNDATLPEKDFSHHKLDNGEYLNLEGDILIDRRVLKKDIDELRQDIWVLLCCFDKDNPNYQCVYEDVEKSGGIARFAEDLEEEDY